MAAQRNVFADIVQQRRCLQKNAAVAVKPVVFAEFRKAAGPVSFPAWWTDPFARGSYSICDPGHEAARDALARPIGNRLFIAGEATAGGGAMTVGGATLAGRVAAAAVARLKA